MAYNQELEMAHNMYLASCARDDLGGYERDFVGPLPAELLCLICTFVAADPMQMDCCGRIYCEGCLTELKKRSNKCPQCRREGNCFEDKKCEREIQALRVRCGNNGCDWVGELGSQHKHWITCDHASLQCPNDCSDGNRSVWVLRKDLETHLKEKCPYRNHQCPHCGEEDRYRDITTSHLEICDKLVVPCPNEGCSETLPRCDIPEHRQTCPMEVVACKYSAIGCEEKQLRKDLEDHEKSNDQLHLDIAMTTIHKVEIAVNYVTFKMAKFSESEEEFYSPPFYTQRGGYRMCIIVDAKGWGGGEGTYLSVTARLMRGENDDNLTWPFSGVVTVELLNQLEDKNHHQDTITFPEGMSLKRSKRVVDRERAEDGFGRAQFISHAGLSYKSITRQFLKEDCLYFRVSVKAAPNPKPWLTCTA